MVVAVHWDTIIRPSSADRFLLFAQLAAFLLLTRLNRQYIIFGVPSPSSSVLVHLPLWSCLRRCSFVWWCTLISW